MINPINGSWFEFQHHNILEGKYWNDICRKMTEAQWRDKIHEMNEFGMEYLVLMASALNDEAYFETDIYPMADLICHNPMEVMFGETEKLGMKVFVSAGFYGEWTRPYDNFIDPEVTKRAFKAMNQLCEKYGKYKSFHGWYLPDEAWINKYFDPLFIEFINKYSAEMHRLSKNYKMLIAPYGAKDCVVDDKFVKRLESIDCDYIAYQDEIGVEKSTAEQTKKYFENLKFAHDKAGRAALWADVETFKFEGKVYHSALVAPEFERLKAQLESVSPYVEKILVYTYECTFNKPGTSAFIGDPNTTKLYTDYKNFFNL
ncbi:MAG: hypothetical protein A2Y17_02920 [Clostridiales bacterium GWF2_38_85]|nr:MAG: hypothetical protein A2Y17_02920 [Clostridiales bacterium GWF2_38_85]